MSKLKNIQNQRFGRLTVLIPNGRKSGNFAWLCRCDCGREVTRSGGQLRGFQKLGRIQDCGCSLSERAKRIGYANREHGKSVENKRLFDVWYQMTRRCNNKKSKDYPGYGGRGIKICQEWLEVSEFFKWAEKSGYKIGLTLERINVNGGYNAGNCTWIPNKRQASNTRRSVRIEFNGDILCLSDWARKIGINIRTILTRYRAGWSIERMLTEHVRS